MKGFTKVAYTDTLLMCIPLRQGVIDQLLGHVPPENVSHLEQQDLGQQHAGLGKCQLGNGGDVHGLR